MLVTCPNCAAGYDVPEHLLGQGGRKLKCARCATQFQAAAPEVVEPAPEPILIAPEPPPLRAPVAEEKPAASQPARGRYAALQIACACLAWTLSLSVAGGASWLAISERGAVMQAWAPSQRVYLALGLSEPAGLAAAAPSAVPAAPATSPPESPPG